MIGERPYSAQVGMRDGRRTSLSPEPKISLTPAERLHLILRETQALVQAKQFRAEDVRQFKEAREALNEIVAQCEAEDGWGG